MSDRFFCCSDCIYVRFSVSDRFFGFFGRDSAPRAYSQARFGPSGHHWLALGRSWGGLGGSLATPWATLWETKRAKRYACACLRVFSVDVLGASWWALGTSLGVLGGSLGVPWGLGASLGGPWVALGRSLGLLGKSWGGPWGSLGGHWRSLGVVGELLGGLRGCSGCLLGSSGSLGRGFGATGGLTKTLKQNHPVFLVLSAFGSSRGAPSDVVFSFF